MTCDCVLRRGTVVTLCQAHEAALGKMLLDQTAQVQKVKARLAPPFDWYAKWLSRDLYVYDEFGRKVAWVESLQHEAPVDGFNVLRITARGLFPGEER